MPTNKLTHEEINQAIAEKLGWKDIGPFTERDGVFGTPPDKGEFPGKHKIPDFTIDANVALEAYFEITGFDNISVERDRTPTALFIAKETYRLMKE